MNIALATRPDEVLIRPASPEEDVLALIFVMRKDKLTAGQIRYIGEQKNRAVAAFRKIVHGKFGFSDEQILDLNDRGIEALFTIVFEKTKKRFWYYYAFCIFSKNWCFLPVLKISMIKLYMAGVHVLTGLDIRQSIQNFEFYHPNSHCVCLMERSQSEKQTLVQRRKS